MSNLVLFVSANMKNYDIIYRKEGGWVNEKQ